MVPEETHRFVKMEESFPLGTHRSVEKEVTSKNTKNRTETKTNKVRKLMFDLNEEETNPIDMS